MLPHSEVIPARLEVTFTQFPGEGERRSGLSSELGLGLGLAAVAEEEWLEAKAAERETLSSVCSENNATNKRTLCKRSRAITS